MASAVSVVALTGFMGSGKTTVGRLVAERLGWSFIDSDDALQKAAGKSIDRIFREEGEEAFRRLERKTLESILGCLLYTSPSPRDGLLSRMPSSACKKKTHTKTS